MKKVILLGGPPGVGKTTLANEIVNSVDKTIMLDGDWCWYQGNNWNFCKENKDMALDNICYLLNNFLRNCNYDNILFSWVLHKKEDHERIISSLRSSGIEFELYDISLVCSEQVLLSRLGTRIVNKANEFESLYTQEDIFAAHSESVKKLEQIRLLETSQIDVTSLSKQELLSIIIKITGMIKLGEKTYIKY